MDNYKVLGLNSNATDKEIRLAYKLLVLKYHPDKNLNDPDKTRRFIKIKDAYEALVDNRNRSDLIFSNDNYASVFNSIVNAMSVVNDLGGLFKSHTKPVETFEAITNICEQYQGATRYVVFEDIVIEYYPIVDVEIEFDDVCIKLQHTCVDKGNNFMIKNYDIYYVMYVDVDADYEIVLPDMSTLLVSAGLNKTICYENRGLVIKPYYIIDTVDTICVHNCSDQDQNQRGNLYVTLKVCE